MIRRCAKLTVELVGFVIAASAILVGIAAWRLSAGPIEISFLTPYLEEALSDPYRIEIGSSQIRWDGFDQPLGLGATDVVLRNADGDLIATVPELAIGVDARSLIHGRIVPTRLELIRPRLYARRDADGGYLFDLGENGETPATRDPLSEPEEYDNVIDMLLTDLSRPEAEAEGRPTALSQLSRLRIVDADLIVDDHLLGLSARASNTTIDLRRNGDGVTGGLSAEADVGGRRVAVSAQGRFDFAERETDIQIAFDGLAPADWAHVHPVLAPMEALSSPLSGVLHGHLDREFLPEFVDFSLSGGVGNLVLPALYAEPVAAQGLEASGTADLINGRLVIDRVAVDLGGPRLLASAEGVFADGMAELTMEATLQDFPIDLLDRYWPTTMRGGGRDWIVANITDGVVRQGTLQVEARAPIDDRHSPEITSIAGALQYEGLSVRYLWTMPRVTGVGGTATFDGSGFDFQITGGAVNGLDLVDGRVVISGLDGPTDHAIDIDVAVTGGLGEALGIVETAPGIETDRLGLDSARAAGATSARLRFVFPLRRDLRFDDVALAASANVVGGSIGTTFSDMPIADVDASLALDGQGLTASGTGVLAGVAADFEWSERFRSGGEFITRLTASATLDDADRTALGLPDVDLITGPIEARVAYTDIDRQRQTFVIDADLTAATVAIPPIAWTKPADTPATARAEVALAGGTMREVRSFALDAPAFAARGAATLDAQSGEIDELTLTQFVQGETSLAGTVRRQDDGGYAISAHGPVFDARHWLDGAATPGAAEGGDAGDGPAPPPLQIAVAFDRLILTDTVDLSTVDAVLVRNETGWSEVRVNAATAGGAAVRVDYEPVGFDMGQFRLTSDNAGQALNDLGLVEDIEGGSLILTGVRQGPPGVGRYDGTIRVDAFTVTQAPVLARILAASSLADLQSAFNSAGVGFDRLEANYTLESGVAVIANGRAAGGALGITFDGTVDSTAGTIDASGTIVPAAGVNRVIGSIPIVGDLLTGGPGEGLFAANYQVGGALADPQVAVNPLSAITPGFLRTLFFSDIQMRAPTLSERPNRDD